MEEADVEESEEDEESDVADDESFASLDEEEGLPVPSLSTPKSPEFSYR